jgi:hypothetical protein
MIGMVAYLDLQGCRLPHHLHVIGLQSQRILEALGSLSEIFSLLVNGAACMPAKHTFHLALQESEFGTF